MPRSATRGVRAEFAVLELFEKNATLTPDEINDFMKNGNYAAKYICYLRIAGYDFDVNRDGRRVVSYTLKGKTPTKSKKAATTAPTASKPRQEKKAKPVKTVAKKTKMPVEEKMLQDLGMLSEREFSASSFSVDPDWDSTDTLDIQNILR